jgi:hypothetical protein
MTAPRTNFAPGSHAHGCPGAAEPSPVEAGPMNIMHPFAAFRRHLPRSRVTRLRDEVAALAAGLDALDRGVTETGLTAAEAIALAKELDIRAGLLEDKARTLFGLARRLGPGAAGDEETAGEAAALARAGIAPGHPESLTAELDEADEEALAARCRELWPHDEYEAITADGDDAR